MTALLHVHMIDGRVLTCVTDDAWWELASALADSPAVNDVTVEEA